MSKIFNILFVFFIFIWWAYAWEDLKIISREEWWANEEYRYLDSDEWKAILARRDSQSSSSTLTESQKENIKKEQLANDFLKNSFSDLTQLASYDKFENGRELAWPISKTPSVKSIVVHHTHTENIDSYESVRSIYKYHSLTNERWDIGYNYLIWYDWEIFEWRAWWDYTVAAHAKYNNRSTVWIALIWDYDNKPISVAQYKSLEKLISYLVEKYNIDLAEKQPFFRKCIWTDCSFPLEVNYKYPIVWHRDAWHTDCPWDELYDQLSSIRTNLLKSQYAFNLDKIEDSLDKFTTNQLLDILVKIENKIDNLEEDNIQILTALNWIKKLILNIQKIRDINELLVASDTSFDKTNKIKVRLSYPYDNYINVEVKWNMEPKLIKRENEYILKFIESENLENKSYHLRFTLNGDKLLLNDNELLSLWENKFFRVSVPEWFYSIIESWDRKPDWDKTGELNDNKFKWDLVLYKKDDKLIVVNDVLLSDYLKWLGEVSNSEIPEKIETVIILARTYARWYMQKARKFEWEWYDASDDPDVFQKYLWYGLELRSPNINKIVDKTQDMVITYENDIIKPWYFSKSTWKTLSFLEYCEKNMWDDSYCKTESLKYPFLVSNIDLWGSWDENMWHWVWVPWTWIRYFSERWWTSSMILKYFLKWVSLQKL